MNIIDISDSLPRGAPYIPRDPAKLRWLVYHHTAGADNPITPMVEPEVIRPEQVADYHIRVNGWSGIGYNYLVYMDGTIYKVRPVEVIPACVKKANTPSVCIAWVGNLSIRAPSQEAWDSAVWLGKQLISAYPTLTNVYGHGEAPGQATQCPGSLVRMDRMRTGVWTVMVTHPGSSL